VAKSFVKYDSGRNGSAYESHTTGGKIRTQYVHDARNVVSDERISTRYTAHSNDIKYTLTVLRASSSTEYIIYHGPLVQRMGGGEDQKLRTRFKLTFFLVVSQQKKSVW
jgi:hypothetical protein